MAWDNSVVTNAGIAMLKKVLSGEILKLDFAAGASGTVPESALMAQTALTEQKQTFTITDAKSGTNGKKVNVQITNKGLVNGYPMKQVGIWAHIGAEAPALLAILQDATGTKIPSESEMSDFAINFYAVIDFSNESDFQVTIDPSALVTRETLDRELDKIKAVVRAARAAEEYNPAGAYAIGGYCTHDGTLYKCTTPIATAEEWNAAHWTATTVGAEIAALFTALEGKAAANHTHAAQDVGADPSGTAETVQANLDAHAARTDNPHGITCAKIGAQEAATAINLGNIGGQSVNWAQGAANANNANAVGGYSAAQLLAAAAAAGAKIEKISYVGTGTAGPSNPTVLAFTKLPKIVFLFNNYQTCILAKIAPYQNTDESWTVISNCYYFNSTGHLGYGIGVYEDGTTIKLNYSNSSYSSASQCQGNLQGTAYSAIGIS